MTETHRHLTLIPETPTESGLSVHNEAWPPHVSYTEVLDTLRWCPFSRFHREIRIESDRQVFDFGFGFFVFNTETDRNPPTFRWNTKTRSKPCIFGVCQRLSEGCDTDSTRSREVDSRRRYTDLVSHIIARRVATHAKASSMCIALASAKLAQNNRGTTICPQA